MRKFCETVVEDATLAWLEGLGWAVKHGPEIAPDFVLPAENLSKSRDATLQSAGPRAYD